MIDKIKSFFLKEDGDKKVLNKTKALIFTIIILALVICFGLGEKLISEFRNKDTSSLTKSSSPLGKESHKSKKNEQGASGKNLGGVEDKTSGDSSSGNNSTNASTNQIVKIRYKAKQVITRDNNQEQKELSLGVNVIARLLSSIDSRNLGPVKAILSLGVKNNQSEEILPSGTILFGEPSYFQGSKKVQISFSSGALPDGKRINLSARAISIKDNSYGIDGEFHSNTMGRIGSVLGLSMISGTTEVLVEKESLGDGFVPTPKATIKNGLINGLSRVANMEANTQAQELANKPEYVTIGAGKRFIVSFTNLTKGGEQK